jgi:hypothetical protein
MSFLQRIIGPPTAEHLEENQDVEGLPQPWKGTGPSARLQLRRWGSSVTNGPRNLWPPFSRTPICVNPSPERGNFCTIDEKGRVVDRRAARINSEKNRELCALLREIKLPDVELFVETLKEYRLLLVLRGEGLGPQVTDTDPQAVVSSPWSRNL